MTQVAEVVPTSFSGLKVVDLSNRQTHRPLGFDRGDACLARTTTNQLVRPTAGEGVN